MNPRFNYFFSLQREALCDTTLSLHLELRQMCGGQVGGVIFFIYLLIGFIKTHLLPTGLGLPTEKQLSQLKQLVSKVPNYNGSRGKGEGGIKTLS